MRFTTCLMRLTGFLVLGCIQFTLAQHCDENYGEVWLNVPKWASTPRHDLRCQKSEDCNEDTAISKAQEYDKCCICRSCAVWEGLESELFIEYVSVLGKSLILSDKASNDTEVFKIEHIKGDMTEFPSNLCDVDIDLTLKERYQVIYDNMKEVRNQIVNINFTNNQIHTLPDINCLTRLDTLTLTNNRITYISNSSFTNLTNLRKIDFSWNYIKRMDPFTLNSPKLQSLFFSDFSHNELTAVDVSNAITNDPYCRFDFESNEIEEITNEANFKMNLSENALYGPGFFSLAYNELKVWPDFETLLNLDTISQLGRLIDFGFDMQGIPLACDCNLEEFMSKAYNLIDPLWREYMAIICTDPPNLRGQAVVDLDPAQFICIVEENCDPHCTCRDEPNKETLFLDCSNSGLDTFPEIPPSRYSKYISLNVSGNHITRLEHHTYLSKISILDISDNNILEIDENTGQSLENASYINLSKNPNLLKLPRTFQYHNICSRVLEDLQLYCECDSLWMESWMNSKGCLTSENVFKCRTRGGGSKLAISFVYRDLNCSPQNDFITNILITLIVALVVLISVGILVHKFRYELLIIYLRLGHVTKSTVSPMDQYDVFLSFDNDDKIVRKWITSTLYPKLIQANYNVYLTLCDLKFGEERDSQIISALASTRNFLVILSESYLDDKVDRMRSWTKNEWKYGWEKFKTDKSKNIVMINFDHISSFDVPQLQIRAFLRVGCNVDFTNRDRNIMEDIFTKLGKPFILKTNTALSKAHPKPDFSAIFIKDKENEEENVDQKVFLRIPQNIQQLRKNAVREQIRESIGRNAGSNHRSCYACQNKGHIIKSSKNNAKIH